MYKMRRWEELTLVSCSGSAGISTFLQVAASLKVFKAIIIDGPATVSVPAFRAISEAMLTDDHGLEKLELWNMKLSLEQTAALADGLRSPGHKDDRDDSDDSDDFLSSCFVKLYLTGVDFENDAAVSELAFALDHNYSLEIFGVCACNLSDAQVAEVVDSLKWHPNLKILCLGGNQGGARAVEALASLLEQTDVTVLNFADQSRGLSSSCLGVWAEALEGRYDLEVLNLSGNQIDDEGFNHLVRILSTCPRLRTLYLTDNNISVRGLETFAAQKHPSSSRKLDLIRNMFTVEDGACHHLLNLLEGNPQRGRVSTRIGWKVSELRPQIQHLLDFNKSGRVLVTGQGTTRPVPLRSSRLFWHEPTSSLLLQVRHPAKPM
jgi:hypothetical protein